MYVESVFIYNTTVTLNKKIDSFHRWLLGRAVNKVCLKHVYINVELYSVTSSDPWSVTILRRRLNFTGHLLDEKTPARIAPNEFCNLSPGNKEDHNPLAIMRQKRSEKHPKFAPWRIRTTVKYLI